MSDEWLTDEQVLNYDYEDDDLDNVLNELSDLVAVGELKLTEQGLLAILQLFQQEVE